MSCANATGDDCNNGQAAFYYSQGCFIGCKECDHMSGRRQIDLCDSGQNATVNDPLQRSVNRGAEAGSPEDIYKHNPWRYPGNAPVADVCGLAGGTPWGPDAPEAGDYVNTSFAHHGTRGSTLGPLPDYTPPKWTIGGQAMVTWQIRNNHGGGYQYRLCPATEDLTEECFQAHPLDFVREKQAIVFANGTRLPINGTFVDGDQVQPAGSTWSLIPIPPTWLGPRCIPGPNDTATTPNACLPGEDKLMDGPCVPCPGTPGSDCSRCDNNAQPAFEPFCGDHEAPGSNGDGACEGNEGGAAVLDFLEIPSDLPAGDYVLGFRYDCEATAQVWSNCADITLVLDSADAAPAKYTAEK